MASRSTLMVSVGSARFWKLRLCLLGAGSVLFACGPIVAAEQESGPTDSANAVEMDTSGPNASGGSPLPMACSPGELLVCMCPGAVGGLAECDASGALGECVCDASGSTGEAASTGTLSSGENGWGSSTSSATQYGSDSSEGSSGSTSGEPVACLPLDEPCPGTISVQTDAEVEAIAACSRIEGSLQIQWGVTDLSPLSCLRELGNQLFVGDVNIPTLSALSNLERIEGELEVGWTQLTALDLNSLESVGYFSLYENEQMVTLGVPNLTTIEGNIDVTDNPLLPTCELEALAEEALSPMGVAYYVGNADDGCPSSVP